MPPGMLTAPSGYEVKDLAISQVKVNERKVAGGGTLITELEGLVAAFGNVDSYNDVIEPGAFKTTLTERVPARKVKLLADHVWDTDHTLGTIDAGEETDAGLLIHAEVDEDDEVQRRVGKVARKHVTGLSIGYETMRADFEQVDGDDVIRHLTEVKLFEGSITPFPANEEAIVLGVKSPEALARYLAQAETLIKSARKVGRRNSSSDESRLRSIMQLVEELLESGDEGDEPDKHTARSESDGMTAPLAGSRLVIARAKIARESYLELTT